MFVGMGYDVHRLTAGRKLILGGVSIPFDRGLAGHSDADVLVHAICDGLLGAAGLGDIGRHFPDTDSRFKDICSIELLKRVFEMLSAGGFAVGNVDATVVAEAPKLATYRAVMEENIAAALHMDPGRVNVKATTAEGLGSIGRGEGVAAMSVVSLVASGPS